MRTCAIWGPLLLVGSCVVLADPEADPSEELFNRLQQPKNRNEGKCYDENDRPQRCIPPFENAAFNVLMEATNTCGEDHPIEFCRQTGVQKKSCQTCQRGDHSASFLTDHDNNDNATWWQSDTIYEGIEYPNQGRGETNGLRVTLDRLNTFGDEVFGDAHVLKSYYYAIADVAVGARCACNGHAGECVNSTSVDGRTRRVCRCEHNTAGPDCNECLPFFNDAPWGRATTTDAHECRPCNCNGYSDRCYFDKELYKAMGHGGHCLDCRANRDGANCERCRENFYQRLEDDYCVACNCDEIGSRSLQCNSKGKCQCKPGVTGDKCDRCAANFYNFGSLGCTSCECSLAGSADNVPNCDSISGVCVCKENVEGKRCRECRPGFFNLAVDNKFGCTPCFCYGHSSVCRPATGYSKLFIENMFVRGNERWSASVAGNPIPLHYDALTQTISVTALDRDNVYFLAPDRFLGDQRASYNQDLSFILRIGETGPAPTARDVILEGGNGEQITQPIFGQGNRLPTVTPQEYHFRLHEDSSYGWQPRLSSRAFMSILSNLTAIKIRGTYTHQGRGFLDDVKLETAHRGAAGESADWVEHCQCPHGYVGQFCESCAPGFHHDPPNGGPFALCVPCNCNGHADICEAETGQCICQHNTAGSNCELCSRGYYGYPLKGTPDDCKPCPCPDNGPCILLGNNPDPICSECPIGRTGPRCETCSDGYYGNPERGLACRPCDCNNNIDLNAVRNCNHETGECLKCVNNTAGFHCEECLSGYYGDALSDRREDGCKLCQCYPPGTSELDDGRVVPCDQLTGHCACKPHVVGRNCDKCEEGYYHIMSGEGCTVCNCDLEGSYNRTCDPITGQCQCRPGVTGQHCDACEPYQYGFSREGCKSCDCDSIGSQDLQCDANGQCPCLTNVEGRRCDRCKENKHNRQHGCIDCPDCYNLVQSAVNDHRRRLAELEDTLNKINSSPTVIKDSDFEKELKNVQDRVKALLTSAKEGSNIENKTLAEQLDELREQLNTIDKIYQTVDVTASDARDITEEGLTNMDEAEKVLDIIFDQLKEAENYLATDGANALAAAKLRAEQVGQQNRQMTSIAQEARVLAEINTNEAKKLHMLAEQARNTTLEAYNLAKQTISKYSNITDEIRGLENKLAQLEDRMDEVRNLTAIAAAKSSAVSQEALDLLILDLTLPTVDLEQLRQQVETVSNEGLRIKEQAQLLLEQNENFIKEMSEKVKNSEELLDRAQDQQAATAEHLAELDEANETANDAVKRGDQTLKEAQETLKKLGEFDAEVQRERIKAQDALQDIDDIEKLIESASMQAKEVERVLNGSEDKASANANNIRMEANKTKIAVLRLGNEAEKLHLRVDTTDSIMKEYEIQMTEDANVTAEANHKVGQAKINVTLASQQVDKALSDVAAIIRELENLPEIDDVDLNRLEERLVAAETEIKAANLDQRIRALTEAKNLQTQWVKNYEDEVSRLRIEVENIDDIRKALPTDCYQRLRLEP
ncbi:Laminin subunit gamma-1 [Camponotus floridanus]|uniref:Laminin subunit gamma-1 n=1 Tax=Camponotus floridanus TaxID=104421 RepID=E2AN97_CAMFO|nr:Laminin subunit gamma-1 [Camponotus floridanus]